jgi:hypothetical protein
MWLRRLEILAIAAFAFAIGFCLAMILGLGVAAWYDHHLYVRLIGPSMAMPDWEPWWGSYLLRGISVVLGLVQAVAFAWAYQRATRTPSSKNE